MNAPVDVLAVMDAACCVLAIEKERDPQRQLEQARAAVAELIEASAEAHGCLLPFGNAVQPHARLTAALSRVHPMTREQQAEQAGSRA